MLGGRRNKCKHRKHGSRRKPCPSEPTPEPEVPAEVLVGVDWRSAGAVNSVVN